MNTFQYISRNFEQVKKDVSEGKTTIYLIPHFSLYCRYDFYRRDHSVSESVFFAAEDFKVSDRTVYKIIKEMEHEIQE